MEKGILYAKFSRSHGWTNPFSETDVRPTLICTYRLLTELRLSFIYVSSSPKAKGRELEDFDRMFAGEEDRAVTETMNRTELQRVYFTR